MAEPTSAAHDIESLFAKPHRTSGRQIGTTDKKPRRIRHDASTRQETLSAYRTANPNYLKHWHESMNAARALLPSCEYIRATGDRCTQPPIRGESMCRHHLDPQRMAERDTRERQRLQEFEIDRLASPSIVLRALKIASAIELRQLRRLWESGLWETSGQTLLLHARDDSVVRRVLLKEGIDIIGGGYTAFTIDRLRWAAYHYLREAISETRFRKRIAWFLEQERRWCEKASSTNLDA